MKPASFVYHAPRTLEEALELAAELGDEAKFLAGGQSLVPAMNFRLAQPAALIDLNRVPELCSLRLSDDGGLAIGAMTRQRTVERDPRVAERAPLLHQALPYVAHPQIRNRGTIGGSLAHADPASELPAVALALEARLRLRNRNREREVAAADFYTGLFETALEPDELLVEVVLPQVGRKRGFAFDEVSRRHGDYALVGVAVAARLDPQGRSSGTRIALLSVGDGPVLAREAIALLEGELPSPEAVRAGAAAAAERDIDPPSDIHASAAFRRHLARVLTERALQAAFAQATGTG